jgi:hypothetical protein
MDRFSFTLWQTFFIPELFDIKEVDIQAYLKSGRIPFAVTRLVIHLSGKEANEHGQPISAELKQFNKKTIDHKSESVPRSFGDFCSGVTGWCSSTWFWR